MVGFLRRCEIRTERRSSLITLMSRNLINYVVALCGGVRVDSRTRTAIDREIRAHLEDHTDDLQKHGLDAEEASRSAIQSFGNPYAIARDLLVVHSRGTWQDSFLTSLPHLLVALLLTAYYQQSVVCIVALLLVAGFGIGKAFTRKAPSWSFSWLGYCLVPFILAIFLLLGATHWWTILGIAYIPCAVTLTVYAVRQTVSRDPLYVSLMISPWAVITAWFIATQSFSPLISGQLSSLSILGYSRPLVGSFVALAISSFVFARIEPRWGKSLALIVPLAIVLLYVSLICRQDMSLFAWFAFVVALVVVSAPTVREFLR